MDSAPAGKLTEGEIIEVIETKELDAKTTRVRFDRGWTSVKAKSGKLLLELVVDEDSDDDDEEEEVIGKIVAAKLLLGKPRPLDEELQGGQAPLLKRVSQDDLDAEKADGTLRFAKNDELLISK